MNNELVFIILGLSICSFKQCCSRPECAYYEYGVNQAEQNYIVNEHNKLRLLIARGKLPGQPRGVNLKRISWDNNLAVQAQNIANTCIYGHVKVNDPRFAIGQNIYTSYATNYIKGANWTAPIYSWWDEYKIYRYPDESSKDTGHYTQMAWDDTKYVGCGYTYYPIDSKPPFKYQKYYVCNYGPSGNYPRAPYKQGNSGCENLC